MATETTERYPAAPPKPGHSAIMAAIVCVIIAASILSFEAAMFMGSGQSAAPLFRTPVIYLTLVGLALVALAAGSIVVGGVQVYRSVTGPGPTPAPPAPTAASTGDEPTDPWARGAAFPGATYGTPAVVDTADVGS
ncbi:MAG: hypothetical protein V4597_19305 [Pseudomonadota bacterium]